MKRLLLAFLTLFFFVGAFAQDGGAPPAAKPHPLLWKVTGKNSTVYLFGSVHILSPTLKWRDARIDSAIAASGTFYFETPLDPDAMKAAVGDRGTLPPGKSLRAMLPPKYQKMLDDDLAELGLPESVIDGRRPWLAGIVMLSVQLMHMGGSPMAGVDVTLMAEVKTHGKEMRYFETNEQQLALLIPKSPRVELKQFEEYLTQYKTAAKFFQPLVDAWLAGDIMKMEQILADDPDSHDPEIRKRMIDDRNKRFAKALKGVLDNESGTFFVTVGEAHLLGKPGVPELLRGMGYKVELLP